MRTPSALTELHTIRGIRDVCEQEQAVALSASDGPRLHLAPSVCVGLSWGVFATYLGEEFEQQTQYVLQGMFTDGKPSEAIGGLSSARCS